MAYVLRLSMSKLTQLQLRLGVEAQHPARSVGELIMPCDVPPDGFSSATGSKYDHGERAFAAALQDLRRNQERWQRAAWNTRERAQLGHTVRKSVVLLRKQLAVLREVATKEARLDEWQEAAAHFRHTEETYHQQCCGHRPSDSPIVAGDTSPTAIAEMWASDSGAMGSPRSEDATVAVTDDPEFAGWMERVREKDRKMDVLLDAISTGLVRMKETALAARDEIEKQTEMLAVTEERVDEAVVTLEATTKRLNKITERVAGESCCMYVTCIVLLLAVGCAIATLALR